MKKTTKILLVLAAVVAMTIGAVSTVMAADEYPVIGEWIEVEDKGWTAKDVNGEDIVRGWATKDGFWYFFDSSYMLVNTFITWNEEIYYLDGEGHMAVGWIGFDNDADDDDDGNKYDTKINTVDKYERRQYDNISLIEGFDGAFDVPTEDAVGEDLFEDYFVADSTNEVLWCFFNDNGTMAFHEWYEAWGLWYFSYGAYAVLGDYQVAIDLGETGADKFLVQDGEGFYGFAPDGHMYVGWTEIVETSGSLVEGDETDDDTPYKDKDADDDSRESTSYWTYYHTNGRQVNTTAADPKDPAVATPTSEDIYEGWEKIDGNWCYFIQDEDYGMVLLQDDFIYDANTDEEGKLDDSVNNQEGTFYVDANGYLVKGIKTFAKGTTIGTWEEKIVSSATDATASTLEFAVGAATFAFDNESGNMLYGIQDNYYYLTRVEDADVVFEVIQSGADQNVTTTGAIELDMADFGKIYKGETTTTDAYVEGQRLVGKNYFVALLDVNDLDGDDDETDVIVYYFESGKMQKNQAITFGSVTIAIDKNGLVLGVDDTLDHDEEVVVAGHKYKIDANNADNAIILDSSVTIHGVQK